MQITELNACLPWYTVKKCPRYYCSASWNCYLPSSKAKWSHWAPTYYLNFLQTFFSKIKHIRMKLYNNHGKNKIDMLPNITENMVIFYQIIERKKLRKIVSHF